MTEEEANKMNPGDKLIITKEDSGLKVGTIVDFYCITPISINKTSHTHIIVTRHLNREITITGIGGKPETINKHTVKINISSAEIYINILSSIEDILEKHCT